MLANPSSSIHNPPPPVAPVLTFFGPDVQHQVHAIDARGQEVARFIINEDKKSFNIARIMTVMDAPMTICSGKTSHSGLSSAVELHLHGSDIHIKADLSGHYAMRTSQGKLKWKAEGIKKLELYDGAKTLLARAETSSSQLQVYVVADEALLDLILCSCIAMLKYKKGSEKIEGGAEVIQAGAEVANALGACVVA